MDDRTIMDISGVIRATIEVEAAKKRVFEVEQTQNQIRDEFATKYGLNALSAIDILMRRIDDRI